MVWKKTKDGWVYSTPTNLDLGTLHEDRYVRLLVDRESYQIVVDGRRKVHTLTGHSWVALFFGQGDVRKKLKGKVLWSDRNVSMARYGLNTRSYVIVAKREKENDPSKG